MPFLHGVRRWAPRLVVLVALVGAAWQVHTGRWRVPDRWNPWAPLALDDPPGLVTRYKLQRLAHDLPQCRATLAQAGWQQQPLDDRDVGNGCGWRGAMRIERLGALRVSAPFTLSCPAAVSLAMWQRQVLQPAAERRFGEAAVRLDHFGSYACRNLYGQPDAARSRHASADALDVAGIALASGRRITVARDWHGSDANAAFLRELHDGACGFFDVTLGPGYNAAHRDHFHLDRGGGRACR